MKDKIYLIRFIQNEIQVLTLSVRETKKQYIASINSYYGLYISRYNKSQENEIQETEFRGQFKVFTTDDINIEDCIFSLKMAYSKFHLELSEKSLNIVDSIKKARVNYCEN